MAANNQNHLNELLQQLFASVMAGNGVPGFNAAGLDLNFGLTGGDENAGMTFQFQTNSPTTIVGDIRNYVFGDGQFQHLMNHFLENAEQQQKGLSQEDLAHLEKTNIKQDQVDKGIQCITCMETLKLGEEVIKLDCAHVFHEDCIFPWLVKNPTCPICRHEIEMQDEKEPEKPTEIDELD